MVVTFTSQGGPTFVEVDEFPLSDDAGKWSAGLMTVNGKTFPLGAVGAGLFTSRVDVTGAVKAGVNTLELVSTDGTDLLHGIQAVRVVPGA